MEPGQVGDSTLTGAFEDGPGPALVYFAFRAGAWLASLIPDRSIGAVARLTGAAGYRLSARKRAIVARNLARVVGDGPHLDGVVRAAFESYARYWVETFRAPSYSRARLLDMVECKTTNVLDAGLAGGRGAVITTGHFGFYDLAVSWLGLKGYPLAAVAEVLRPRALFEWFAESRRARGMEIIPNKPRDEARRLQMEFLARGGGLALVSDRDLGRRGVWVTLFGERTTIPAGPARIVAQAGVPLIFGSICLDGGRYVLDLERLEYSRSGDERADISAIAQTISDALERMVRRSPEQWHLFSTNWPSDEPNLPARGSE